MKALLKFIVLLFIASNMIAQTWTTYNNDNTDGSLPLVICLATDASGNIWIGSYRSLVKYDQGTTWTVYNSSNSLVPNDNNVIDIAVDNSNNIWACTYASGLLSFNGSTWQQYLPSNSGILSNYTYCVGFDTPGNVWTGIYSSNASNAGVMKWDRGSNWTPYAFTDTYNYKNVEAIAKDNDGNIWCGTTIGLYKYNPTNSSWTVYTKENTSGGLGGNWIRVIAPDASGNIWLGTMDFDLVNNSWVGAGLTKFTPSSNLWVNYIPNSQNPNRKVVSAIAFRNNDVWVGTGFCGQYNGNGLYKFDRSNWTHYVDDNNTFPTSCVNDLVVDKNNNLWIASSAGLTKVDFNPTAVEEYIETIPTQFTLNAYPNPFNPTTKIEFSIPTAGKYTIKVYNTLGQEVSMLVDHELVAGVHSVTFDASGLASGIYICKLDGADINLSKKIVLMK